MCFWIFDVVIFGKLKSIKISFNCYLCTLNLIKIIVKMKYIILFFIIFLSFSCENMADKKSKEVTTTAKSLQSGLWRVSLASEGGEIPFNLYMNEDDKNSSQKTGYIINAEEKIILDKIIQKNDSITIPLHIFDAALVGKIENDSVFSGVFRKYYAPTKDQPFKAYFGQNYRFKTTQNASKPDSEINFNGKWEIVFTDKDKKSYPAVGVFQQVGENITGTFLTETGDYRYLEGNIIENEALLSTFDGNHAFLFKFRIDKNSKEEKITGEFWSGVSYKETFVGKKNAKATLKDAFALTFLKKGYEKIAFKFPDLNGKMVSLDDEKYKNKVVILQIFGSWCPNCMDETEFLADWYNKNKNQEVAIIALAYERKADFEYAKTNIQKVQKRFNATYDFLVAGTDNKVEAAKTLPMLSEILAFPTTIYIDKKGVVRKIYTGFSGKGTGEYYTKFVEDFNDLMGKMLKE